MLVRISQITAASQSLFVTVMQSFVAPASECPNNTAGILKLTATYRRDRAHPRHLSRPAWYRYM